MNFFGFHFCHEELIAMFASLPFVGLGWAWLREKYHRFTGKKPECGNDSHTCHEHDEEEQ